MCYTYLDITISPTAFAGFSRPQYVFAEEDGTGSVMIEGTPGVEVRVRGGRLASNMYSDQVVDFECGSNCEYIPSVTINSSVCMSVTLCGYLDFDCTVSSQPPASLLVHTITYAVLHMT